MTVHFVFKIPPDLFLVVVAYYFSIFILKNKGF